MGKVKDMKGQRFGRLIVVKLSPTFPIGAPTWECVCDCGKEKVVLGQDLRRRRVRSCGCLKIEGPKTHGLTNAPEYNIWRHMRDRCLNKKNKNYHRYGGRGISICDEWIESFEAFYRDVGARPGPGYSIDRINNDKGYNKENCKWSTKEEQANNRSTSVYYKHNGVSRTLAGWCRELKLDYSLVRCRISSGWSFERAIAEPTNGARLYKFNGEEKSIKLWCEKLNLKYATVTARISRYSYTFEEAIGKKERR